MAASATSLLQTALQNLHVAQQAQTLSQTPRPPSSRGDYDAQSVTSGGSNDYEDEDDGEMVGVGEGTRPGTPLIGQKGLSLSRGGSGGGVPRSKDPVSSRRSSKNRTIMI
jgi:hypothetical protein